MVEVVEHGPVEPGAPACVRRLESAPFGDLAGDPDVWECHGHRVQPQAGHDLSGRHQGAGQRLAQQRAIVPIPGQEDSGFPNFELERDFFIASCLWHHLR